jgi:2-amino-4-hydroxy-6-hydroxymethyldihydropteridine diphosphokinase
MTDCSGIIAFIGIGSNQGDPFARCREAVACVAAIKGCKFLRGSSLYRTEPVGYPYQDWFANAVLEIRTILPAPILMQELQLIETRMGRQETVKWGPRVIDLDILFYGQEVIRDENITIPHPELHRRRFVLEPLLEIAPYFIHPGFGVSIAGLMGRLEDSSIVELFEKRQDASWV